MYKNSGIMVDPKAVKHIGLVNFIFIKFEHVQYIWSIIFIRSIHR